MDSMMDINSPIKLRRKYVNFDSAKMYFTTPSSFPSRRHSLNTNSYRAHKRNRQYGTILLMGFATIFSMTSLSLMVARNFGVSPGEVKQRVVHWPVASRRLGSKSATVHVGEGPIKTFVLSNFARDKIYRQVAGLKVDSSKLLELESFLEESKEIVKEYLDPDILYALKQLHNTSSPISAVHFRNIPLDPYVPPNPTDGGVSLHKPTFVAEAMLTAMGELSGSHVVGYSSEKAYSNPWIHEGFPRNSGGSALTKAAELSFHQDMSYTEPPDVLGLVCVREGHDTEVQTELIDNRELFETLPESVVSLLRESRFQIKTSEWVDTSESGGNIVNNDRRPILADAASLALPVDWENMIGLDPSAQDAVARLQHAIQSEAPKHYIHFAEGDMLLFSNVRVVHARTPYKDLRFDGMDRVMYRSYFKKSLTKQQRHRRMV
eukprot:CAMPEP_0194133170 /NCGR_PEP_ID=MMETSP0152-20130528/3455_1 /TAXON_ID=1049557 /ORGANISM="Thalassiothrix antarctica, Strain L6-D1" /LENGTH=433 /DNA_ID=CAMNT_0038828437 /DNA_START=196 /DNA_END=1497 /DNA_ORIENTATION=-